MTKTRLTAALSLVFALVAGCSTPETPSATNDETNNTTQAVIPVKLERQKPDRPLTVNPTTPDPTVQQQVEQYVNGLAGKGFAKEGQGIWIQAGDQLLANHQGTTPLPAASVTKAATSLAALSTLGPDHQYITEFRATGPIENGVLQGDLVVQGGQDPFFVWEEAIAIGNLLNQQGIQRVTGDLIIVDQFYMNFKDDPETAGNLLKQGLNSQSWSGEVAQSYSSLPTGTPKPQVAIAGTVKVLSSAPNNTQSLIRHRSFPLAELLKKMNRYSNNYMSHMIADSVGGAKVVAKIAAQEAGVPQSEIQLINGSGLGKENQISPRAAVAIFLAIENYLKPYDMTVGDIFNIVGQDVGILNSRGIPSLSVVKSGTLNDVSALAGVLATQQKETVWFAIMNYGPGNLDGFRREQETLLNRFVNQWGRVSSLPARIQPLPERQNQMSQSEVLR